MKKIRLHLGVRSYDILIGRGLLKSCGILFKKLKIGHDAVVITNIPLARLYKSSLERALKKAGFSIHFETVPDSERAKSIKVASRLINKISAYDKNREVFIVALGGGVIGDLAGFVASTYKRGIPYIQIPTTLLAQVDSAIGGKVAIDLPIAKNLVGAFYQPKAVLSDISLLKSLSKRQVKNGLSEIIKYGIINDKALFEYLERNYRQVLSLKEAALEYVISKSSKIKAELVERDEFDKKGIRAILNYGHTIGHAVEAASGYAGRFSHGEAVAIGMVGAVRISARLGMIKAGDANRIESLIKRAGLPTDIKGLKFARIYEAHLHDKKFIHRKNRFILPTRIGNVKVVEDVPDDIIKDVIRGLFKR